MTTSRDTHAITDAVSHSTGSTYCESRPRGLDKSRPTRPRVLVIGADGQVGYSLRRALEAECDIKQVSCLDNPIDGLLQEADLALVDWSVLHQVTPNMVQEDTSRDALDDLPTVDLKAVRRLGAILKNLSVSSRARRRAS
jgi:hypothetical protein